MSLAQADAAWVSSGHSDMMEWAGLDFIREAA